MRKANTLRLIRAAAQLLSAIGSICRLLVLLIPLIAPENPHTTGQDQPVSHPPAVVIVVSAPALQSCLIFPVT